jgi:hypothetical protein
MRHIISFAALREKEKTKYPRRQPKNIFPPNFDQKNISQDQTFADKGMILQKSGLHTQRSTEGTNYIYISKARKHT